MEPRAYSQSPVGLNFLTTSYVFQTGDVGLDASAPVSNLHADINGTAIGVGRVIDVAGRQANIGLIAPYIWGSLSGDVQDSPRSIYRAGFGDPQLRLSMFLLGGAAATPKEFASRKPGPTLGISFALLVPLGQYDRLRYVNIGANRWGYRPQIGFSFPSGHWQADGYAGVAIYQDNSDFYGGHRRSQTPVVSYQAHLSYTFRPRLWLAADATYYSGGEVAVDGVRALGAESNVRIGASLSVPVARAQSLKFSYSDGVVTRVGGAFQAIGVTWQYAWIN
jgi:hypothetical protein